MLAAASLGLQRFELDLLGGALDGVIVRITFAPDGRPLLLDTIHACGCYHLFFPAAGVALRDGAPTHEEWAFVAGALPAIRQSQGKAAGTDERLVVRIATALFGERPKPVRVAGADDGP